MTSFDTRHNHRTYDADTHRVVPKDSLAVSLKDHRVVPKDAVVLDMAALSGAAVAHLREGAKLSQTHPFVRATIAAIADQIEAATKPPRIEEPGLWSVVEAWKRGIPTRRWVHHEEDRWVSDAGHIAHWDELDQAVEDQS